MLLLIVSYHIYLSTYKLASNFQSTYHKLFLRAAHLRVQNAGSVLFDAGCSFARLPDLSAVMDTVDYSIFFTAYNSGLALHQLLIICSSYFSPLVLKFLLL